MIQRSNNIIRLFLDGAPIDEALLRASNLAYQDACWTGVPLAIWQDAKIVHLDPNDSTWQRPPHFAPPRSSPPPGTPL
jgi:hypothetical protein